MTIRCLRRLKHGLLISLRSNCRPITMYQRRLSSNRSINLLIRLLCNNTHLTCLIKDPLTQLSPLISLRRRLHRGLLTNSNLNNTLLLPTSNNTPFQCHITQRLPLINCLTLIRTYRVRHTHRRLFLLYILFSRGFVKSLIN